MKLSIRKFLLINLLITIITATVFTILGDYYLEQRDIEKHLDILLSQACFSIEALLGDDFYQRDLTQLQLKINEIPKVSNAAFKEALLPQFFNSDEKYQFQVWSKQQGLLLRSPRAPEYILSHGKQGFAYFNYNNHKWRTFTKYSPKLGIFITIAEKHSIRQILANRIAFDAIYIMLLTYPVVALLIWLIVGQGLKSVKRVTDEVSHRIPSYLEPVDSKSIPPEIKPLVVELNKLFLRLQQAIDREKRFAGDAAHELRTPLAGLKTQAQVALKTKVDRERKQLLRNVITGVDRCTHVVQQLLTLSRLAPESKILGEASRIDLPKLTAEVLAQLAPIAIEKKIDIELLAEDKSSIINGNITAISILIRNLVDNAIRYTPENGRITTSIITDANTVILKVIDNGPGIPAELRARVFERFFRVLGNKSTGSGLGLAIVQQIANLHEAQLKLGPPMDGKGLEVEVTFKKLETRVSSGWPRT